VPELLSQAYSIGAATFRYFDILILAGLLYLALTIPASWLVGRLERGVWQGTWDKSTSREGQAILQGAGRYRFCTATRPNFDELQRHSADFQVGDPYCSGPWRTSADD
jgi:hypothetical protein